MEESVLSAYAVINCKAKKKSNILQLTEMWRKISLLTFNERWGILSHWPFVVANVGNCSIV